MSVVDEVRSRLDIVEVVGAYVPLTRVGKNYRGFSPFKTERTPSFFVFPHTQTFKDFSSGAQGDVFTFVMLKEGWTFAEALRELARRAGVALAPQTPEQQRRQQHEQRLRAALEAATEYFHHLLLSAPQAEACRRYLREQRRLSHETITAWRLGYSLDDYHALTHYLTAKGFTAQELLDAGLLVENEEGRRYDRFRGRLMIPIRDARGEVVGFGSRSLDGSEPKYMNSPQTALFDKGQLLFGLDRARAAIRDAGVAVLVEGYMDVIGCHQAGFTNVVAGMGTSLTEAQLRALRRLAPRIVLALDADTAGQRAVLRSLDIARTALDHETVVTFDARGAVRAQAQLNADLRVALLPEGKDPDEIVLEAPQQWQQLVAEARPILDYVIEVVVKQHSAADAFQKSQAVRTLAPLLIELTDPIQRDSAVQQLAQQLRLSARAVMQVLREFERAAKRQPPRTSPHSSSEQAPSSGAPSAAEPASPVAPPPALELHLIALLFRKPELLFDINAVLARAGLELMSEDDFSNPALRRGFHTLQRVALGAPFGSESSDEDEAWLVLLADYDLLGHASRLPAARLEVERHLDENDAHWLREQAIQAALRLRELRAHQDRAALPYLIEDARRAGDQEALQRYNLRLTQALQQLLRAQKARRLRSALV
ncbi:MAG: DNA primase [Anaerolineae bacterium]|nr:DNA primase [Thermoflexales bacterium]MDW8053742.1 DNA primase [Anaerolineae bacterium]